MSLFGSSIAQAQWIYNSTTKDIASGQWPSDEPRPDVRHNTLGCDLAYITRYQPKADSDNDVWRVQTLYNTRYQTGFGDSSSGRYGGHLRILTKDNTIIDLSDELLGEYLCLNVYENSLLKRAFAPQEVGGGFGMMATRQMNGGSIAAARTTHQLTIVPRWGKMPRQYSRFVSFRGFRFTPSEIRTDEAHTIFMSPKRILGEVPVESDGSFRVRCSDRDTDSLSDVGQERWVTRRCEAGTI